MHSEESIAARERYYAGERLADIARALGRTTGTLRRWKTAQDWDAHREEAVHYGRLTAEEKGIYDAPLDEVAELETMIREDRIRRHWLGRRLMAGENGLTQEERDDKLANTLIRVINSSRMNLGLLFKMKQERAKGDQGREDLAEDWLEGFEDEC